MQPVWHGGGVPGEGGGQALGEVVGRHGSEAPPGLAATGQLDSSTGEHHPEQQPAHQPECDPVLAQTPRLVARGDGAGEDCQDACLQQEDVPLEVEKGLTSLQDSRSHSELLGLGLTWKSER